MFQHNINYISHWTHGSENNFNIFLIHYMIIKTSNDELIFNFRINNIKSLVYEINKNSVHFARVERLVAYIRT